MGRRIGGAAGRCVFALIGAGPARGLEVIFEASDVALHDLAGDTPHVTFTKNGKNRRIRCHLSRLRDDRIFCAERYGYSGRLFAEGAGAGVEV